MAFVDVDRIGIRQVLFAPVQPRGVAPFVAVEVIRLGGVARTGLEMEAVRVGLVKHIAGLGPYTILVCGIFRNIRNKFLPDTLFIARHIIGVAIPVVELTHDGNFFGLRCINTEQITLFIILHERVGSHVIERATIPAGIEKLASLFRGGCCGFFLHTASLPLQPPNEGKYEYFPTVCVLRQNFGGIPSL